MVGKLLDYTEYQILLDTGVKKSSMSKLYNLRCITLHALPKFASKTQRIQVGNGQYVHVLFIVLVIIDIHGHCVHFGIRNVCKCGLGFRHKEYL